MHSKTLVGVIAGLSLIAAACGDDANDAVADPVEAADEAADEAAADEADEEAGDEMSDDEMSGDEMSDDEMGTHDAGEEAEEMAGDVPQAIVSLSPTSTEILYAIGAGDQVLAVDDFSNYPPEAAEKMQGISGFQPNVESIAALEPDLVVTGGTAPDFLAQLDELGIPHWEGPAAQTFDDVYTQIEQLGAATGHVAEAAELVVQMQTEIDEIRAGLPELDEPLTYYHELDESYYSVTSDTFIGAVYAEVGLVNITEAAEVDTQYPQLNAEFIVEQDPDLIFLACSKYCGTTAESVGERDGWGEMTAVTTGGVIEVDDDIASRWGPRIVDHLRAVGDAVAEVAALQSA